jgi:hypothetical protein
MRFDTDFGSYLTDAPTGEARIRELPRSLSVDQFQLLFAVVGGSDVFGFLDFQLGRQIVFDVMDFYSFDGIDVRVRLPWWVAVEASTGFEVRGESPLASPIYELDGTSPGSRDPATCLSVVVTPPPPGCRDQNGELAPMVALALESWGLQTFHGRLAFRRTFSDTADHHAGDGLPNSGVNEEKISYTVNASFGPLRPFGGLRYDLLLASWDQLEAGVRALVHGHSILAEYLYNAPVFDGDSIFNVFATTAYNDARGTYTTPELGAGLRLWGTGFYRRFGDEATRGARVPDNADAYGVTAGGRMRVGGRGQLRVDGYYDDGFGGQRGGGDVGGRYTVVLDRLDVDGRLTLIHFAPDLQKQNNQEATSFGVQAGARYAMAQGVTLHLLIEENANRYYNSQLRALAMLDLGFLR